MEPIRPDDDEVRTGVPGNKVEERKNAKHPCQSRPVMAARANLLENAGKHLAVVVRAAVQCC